MAKYPLLLALGLALVGSPVTLAGVDDVIPRPNVVRSAEGTFAFDAKTTLRVDAPSADAADAVRLLTERVRAVTRIELPVPTGDAAGANASAKKTVLLTTRDADPALGDEGYALEVTPAAVVVRAAKPAGLFYGVQTLLQTTTPAVYAAAPAADTTIELPCVKITDTPRFKWRGLMLDVSRHFMTKTEVMRLLDQMARHKLNVLHWHLTDDQGWRIEIKKYPKLTEVGAWRERAGFGLDPKLSKTFHPDGRYGGFYTQDEVREVVAYAAARHITVVPEIEMPGHATAALRAYPQVGTPAPPSKETKGDAGIFNGVYEPSDERTFMFLEDVLGEVIALFPAPFVHIGGDETPKGPWLNNPPTVAFMKAKGIPDGEHLQGYFVKRIEAFIASRGKRMIGWDEILEGGLPAGAAVMSWRGVEGGLNAARAGHDVVMTPVPFCYLDGEQGVGTEPHERGALLATQKVYSYEPIPAGLPADRTHHVLGVQGNLWTEYVPNFQWAEYLYWPRAAAIAEVGWTKAADKNFDDFARRLRVNEKRLDAAGVNYRPARTDMLAGAITLKDGHVHIADPVDGATVRYTLDGTFPTADSPVYAGPVPLPGGWVMATARYFRPGVVATPAAAATFLGGRAVTLTPTSAKDWETRREIFYTQRWGGGPDESVTVSFDAGPQRLESITIKTGTAAAPDTKLSDRAVLEVSADGKAFAKAAGFENGVARAETGDGAVAAFRVRFMTQQTPHPIIESVTLE